ncbi:peptide-N4-(N-acetyl-beta- glucosaminyl)asparagine amidase A-like [Abeliophyllum distichum]|uniref:Peptide-N4-(N-acetyl-beta-glucosaminyl)asparagine amidase A-like n=1 Tax=Abeliophyllum distichum TaxID=126358 RepID=A0ABD1V4A8_9LAMI
MLARTSPSTLRFSVMLENVVNDIYINVYWLNLTFLNYDTDSNDTSHEKFHFLLSLFPLKQKSIVMKWEKNPVISTLNREENSLDLYESPTNLIILVSGHGDEGPAWEF